MPVSDSGGDKGALPPSSPATSGDRPMLDNDELLTALHAYWNRQRRGRAMPDRRDIDPVDIGPAVLPNVALLDVVDGGARFRYRLAGTAIVDHWGVEVTGKFLDETMRQGGYRDFVHGLFRDACRHRAPIYSSSLFRWNVDTHRMTRRLHLPLTHGGNDTAIILVGQTFFGAGSEPIPAYRHVFDEGVIEQQRREILPIADS